MGFINAMISSEPYMNKNLKKGKSDEIVLFCNYYELKGVIEMDNTGKKAKIIDGL